MKKLVFTIQMIALVAMFPVYFVAELNYETGTMPVNNAASVFTPMPGEKKVLPTLNSEENRLPFLFLETSITN